MKNSFLKLPTALIVLFCLSIAVNNAIAWTRTISMSDDQRNEKAIQTRDGGYLIGSSGLHGNHSYLIRLNANGDSLWSRDDSTYANLVHTIGGVGQLANGGFCYTSFIPDSLGYPHVGFISTDSNGIILNRVRVDTFSSGLSLENLVKSSDGGFYILGNLYTLDMMSNGFLIKVSSTGAPVWCRSYMLGFPRGLCLRGIAPTSDGGLITAGYLIRYQNPSLMALMKVTGTGDTVWTKFYSPGWLYGVDPLPDGGYIACGVDTNSRRLVMRINSTGDTLWTKYYTQGAAFGVRYSPDSSIVVSGEAGNPYPGINLSKLTLSGDLIWSQNYNGSTAAHGGYTLSTTIDGGYLTAGYTQGTPNPAYIVKTDRSGNVSVSNLSTRALPSKIELSQNYPNPFNASTTIRYTIPTLSAVDLRIFDLNGRTVAVLVHQQHAAGIYNYMLDATRFASGIYFYQLQVNGFSLSKKMILIK